MNKCEHCQELMINGVRCHETGCPDAWRHKRECDWCGAVFMPNGRSQYCCSEHCYRAYNGMDDLPGEESYQDDEPFHSDVQGGL